MASVAFTPPLREVLKSHWGIWATKYESSVAQGEQTTLSLVEVPEGGEPITHEVDKIDLANREARERLTVAYIKSYPQLDPDGINQCLKNLYARQIVEILPSPRKGRKGQGTSHGDLFNAEALIARSGEEFCYCASWKRWLYWTGTHWERDHGDKIMEAARETIRMLGHAALEDDDTVLLKHCAKSLNHQPLQRMIAQASTLPGVTREPSVFDTHPWLLNCVNGTLDLQSGTLVQHDPKHFLTKCLTISYDPIAECPTWLQFLWRVMGGSVLDEHPPDESFAAWETKHTATKNVNVSAERLIRFLQRALGYACTGDTGEECLFMLHGKGRNGKSKFLSTIKTVLGPYAKTADMHSFLHRDRETVRNDLADLAGTRFVCASEVSEHTRLAEGLIKQLTGNDAIKARFLFEEYFEFPPTFKLFLAFNHRPKTGNTDDEAFWSRIREIPFTVFIPEEERDKELSTKLCAELPGILAWMVQGCLAWQQERGLHPPDEVKEATAEYRTESDVIGRFLDEECAIHDPTLHGVRTRASDLFEAYRRWGDATHEVVVSKNAFGRSLTERGFLLLAGTNNIKERLGIALHPKESNEDPKKWSSN